MNNAEYLKNFKEINEDIQRVELTLKKDSDNPDLLNQLEELEKEKKKLFRKRFNLNEKKEEQTDDIEEIKKDKEIDSKGEDKDMKVEEGIKADFSGTIQHKFESVEDSQGTMMIKDFDFSIFNGMDSKLSKLEKEINEVKGSTIFSDSYKHTRIREINEEIKLVVDEYEQKAKEHFEELRNPLVVRNRLTSTEEQINLMKRLNNNIVFSNIIEYANTEDLESMFELNKDNSEVRAMMLARMNGLIRDNPKDLKLRELRSAVIEYDKRVRHLDYFEELDNLEFNLMRLFKKSDFFPTGLSKGLEGYKAKKYIRK